LFSMTAMTAKTGCFDPGSAFKRLVNLAVNFAAALRLVAVERRVDGNVSRFRRLEAGVQVLEIFEAAG